MKRLFTSEELPKGNVREIEFYANAIGSNRDVTLLEIEGRFYLNVGSNERETLYVQASGSCDEGFLFDLDEETLRAIRVRLGFENSEDVEYVVDASRKELIKFAFAIGRNVSPNASRKEIEKIIFGGYEIASDKREPIRDVALNEIASDINALPSYELKLELARLVVSASTENEEAFNNAVNELYSRGDANF